MAKIQLYLIGFRFLIVRGELGDGGGGVGGGGGSNPYKGLVYRIGGKACFSLMIYEFCSSNTLYSVSLSFTMFIFLLNHVNT